jgi:hypothetical protein
VTLTQQATAVDQVDKQAQEPKPLEKRNQLSFRVEVDFSDEVEAAAAGEELAVADFVRKVFKWAFAEYKKAGTLQNLRGNAVERQVELEQRVFERIKAKPKGNGGRAGKKK